MNNKERTLLTQMYMVLRRLSDNIPANPMDIAQIGKCQRALADASKPLQIAILSLRDGDLEDALDNLDDALKAAMSGKRGPR